jgi:UPF0716 protein FxsA
MRSEKQTARPSRWRPSIGLILLAGFIFIPLAEIAVFIKVGGWLGLGPTLALIILTAVAGTWMLRHQGLAVLSRAQRQMQQGVLPVAEVFEGCCLVIAGALLLTPGFLTDVAGALLLLPPVRATLYRRLRRHIERRRMPGTAGADQDGQQRERPPIIDAEFDAEFEEVDEPSGPMPKSRGGWDRRS